MLDPNYANDVLEFHRQAGATIGDHPHIPDGGMAFEDVIAHLNVAMHLAKNDAAESRLSRRMAFIVEELIETIEAARDGDLVEFFDGILDLLYVVVGLGITSGLPLNVGWEIVHAANMAKVSGERIEDEKGKIMKPPGWVPPQSKLTELLVRWGANPEAADGESFAPSELLPPDPGPTEIDGHDVRTLNHPIEEERYDANETDTDEGDAGAGGGGLFGRW